MDFLVESKRSRPGDDPIFALNAEASARRAKGEAIVNATVGALLDDDGQLAILPAVIDALRAVPARKAASYAPLPGPTAFHEAVFRELFSAGESDEGRGASFAGVSSAVATPGGTGALRLAITSFLDPGQALLTTSFYWGPYKTIADENDRSVVTFEMFESDPSGERGQAGGLNVAALRVKVGEFMRSQGRLLLILNDPCQNPTGYSMSAAEWEAVADILLEASTLGPVSLLVDVAYYLYRDGLPPDGSPLPMLSQLAPLLGRVGLLFAWSASKSYCQYGARIGALVVVDNDEARRRRAFNALSFACRGSWSNCNHLGLLAVTAILDDPKKKTLVDEQRSALRQIMLARVATFNREAAVYPSALRYPRYEGGFFVTVFVPTHASPAAVAAVLREKGVYVVPQGQGLRVALCSVAERDIPRLVRALAEGLGQGATVAG